MQSVKKGCGGPVWAITATGPINLQRGAKQINLSRVRGVNFHVACLFSWFKPRAGIQYDYVRCRHYYDLNTRVHQMKYYTRHDRLRSDVGSTLGQCLQTLAQRWTNVWSLHTNPDDVESGLPGDLQDYQGRSIWQLCLIRGTSREISRPSMRDHVTRCLTNCHKWLSRAMSRKRVPDTFLGRAIHQLDQIPNCLIKLFCVYSWNL